MSKKALIVGINYRGTGSELNGCINDAENIKKELETRGYKDIVFLTDDTNVKPTRSNILKCFLDLILSGAQNLFFHYSGHGSYIKDISGDEKDGRDETLVPIDYMENGMIIDDELRGIISCLNESQSLTCLLDCCHSGTGVDLRYSLYERYGGIGYSMRKNSKYPKTRGKCVLFSGSRDTETSADAFLGGRYQGAMTFSFIKSLQLSNTYEDMVRNIRKILKDEGFSQNAQFSSGRDIHLNSGFSF